MPTPTHSLEIVFFSKFIKNKNNYYFIIFEQPRQQVGGDGSEYKVFDFDSKDLGLHPVYYQQSTYVL